MFGTIDNPKNEHLKDLNLREFATFLPLIILALWIGIYPSPFLKRLDTSVSRVVARVSPQYIEKTAARPADCGQTAPTSKFLLPPCGATESAPAGAVAAPAETARPEQGATSGGSREGSAARPALVNPPAGGTTAPQPPKASGGQ
jgi:hypothetical protein